MFYVWGQNEGETLPKKEVEIKKEFTIIGLSDKWGWVLVCLAGNSREKAEEILKKQKQNPENAKYKELAINEVNSADCWWNDPFLAN